MPQRPRTDFSGAGQIIVLPDELPQQLLPGARADLQPPIIDLPPGTVVNPNVPTREGVYGPERVAPLGRGYWVVDETGKRVWHPDPEFAEPEGPTPPRTPVNLAQSPISSGFGLIAAPGQALYAGLEEFLKTPTPTSGKPLGRMTMGELFRDPGLGQTSLTPAAQAVRREFLPAMQRLLYPGEAATARREALQPAEVLRRTGVADLPPLQSGILNIAGAPESWVGGTPLDLAKAPMAFAAAAPIVLRGLTSRIASKLIPIISKRGTPASSILAKALSGLVSKEELAYTGIADWLRARGQKPVMPEEFQTLFEQQGIPLYESWYGNAPEAESAASNLSYAEANLRSSGSVLRRHTADYATNVPDTFGDARFAAVEALPPMPTTDQIEQALAGADPRWPSLDRYTKEALTNAASNYKKSLIKKVDAQAIVDRYGPLNPRVIWGNQYTMNGGVDRRELVIGLRNLKPGEAPFRMTQSHNYPDQNGLMHVRMGRYYTDEIRNEAGEVIQPRKKVLVIEELQSDPHDTARAVHESVLDKILEGNGYTPDQLVRIPASAKETLASRVATADEKALIALQGYGVNDPIYRRRLQTAGGGKWKIEDRDTMPDIPFRGTEWQTVAMKRLLKYAAENGYDELGWTTGMQQSQRYGKAYRDITELRMRPDGRVDIYVRNGTYPAQTYGPYSSEREMAGDFGDLMAQRMFEIPVPEPRYTYKVFDPDSNVIATRAFATEQEADAAAAADRLIYHPADPPPLEPTWGRLSYEDQERVEDAYKTRMKAEPEAQATAEEARAQWLEDQASWQARERINERIKRARTQAKIAHTDDLLWAGPDLDLQQTFLPDTPRPAELVGQPYLPGLRRRSKTLSAAPTVRQAIVQEAEKKLGLALDPESLAIDDYRFYYLQHAHNPAPSNKLLRLDDLKLTNGASLTADQQKQVKDIAQEAFKGVETRHQEIAAYINKQVGLESPTGRAAHDQAREAIKNSQDYIDRLETELNEAVWHKWYNMPRDQRLLEARAQGIPAAQPPDYTAPLRPDTGEIGDIEPPNMERVLDTRTNPFTISSKGMVGQYDTSMVQTGKKLGKDFENAVPRRIEVNATEQGEAKVGPLRIIEEPAGTGIRYSVVDNQGQPISGVNGYGDNPPPGRLSNEAARAEAERNLKRLVEDRTIWAMPLTGKMKEKAMSPSGFELISLLGPAATALGTYVWLKNGKRVRVTEVHEDGSFDAEPAPLPRRRVKVPR